MTEIISSSSSRILTSGFPNKIADLVIHELTPIDLGTALIMFQKRGNNLLSTTIR
jgi:hypothetical protein